MSGVGSAWNAAWLDIGQARRHQIKSRGLHVKDRATNYKIA